MSNVSLQHEAPLEVLRHHPEAVLALVRLAGGGFTETVEVEVLESELTETTPSVRHADFVTLLRDKEHRAREVVVVEIQRDRDDEKIFAWPHYAAYLGSRYRVPVTVLVMAFDEGVAAWARTHREFGSIRFTPLVVGPSDLPQIESIEQAMAHPELSMLTALARLAARSQTRAAKHDVEVVRVFEAVQRAEESAVRTAYLVMLYLTARPTLQAILHKLSKEHDMSFMDLVKDELRAQAEAQAEAKGKAKGKADALLSVLRARGLQVDDRVETRIRETSDQGVLDRWLVRAATATTANDLLVD